MSSWRKHVNSLRSCLKIPKRSYPGSPLGSGTRDENFQAVPAPAHPALQLHVSPPHPQQPRTAHSSLPLPVLFHGPWLPFPRSFTQPAAGSDSAQSPRSLRPAKRPFSRCQVPLPHASSTLILPQAVSHLFILRSSFYWLPALEERTRFYSSQRPDIVNQHH